MTVVGEASVLITPLTAGFEEKLKSKTAPAFSGFQKESEKAGAEAGGKMHAGFSKGLGGIAGSLAGLGVPLNTLGGRLTTTADRMAAVEKQGSKLGATMASLGGLTLVGTAAGFAAVAAAGVDLAVKQEKVTVSIANSARISEAAAHKISNAFLDTAGSAMYSGKEIGEAFQPVAGVLGAIQGHALSAGEATKFMGAAIDLAEASGEHLGPATEALTKVMQAYHVGVEGASGASDILWNTSRQTGIGIDQLATVITRVKGKLGEMAPSLAETGGLLNSLAKAGVTGRIAVSALSSGFNTLLGGGKASTAMAKQLGLTIFDSSGHFVGLRRVIEQLNPKFTHLTQEQQLQASKALFGAGANRQMLDVILKGPHAFDTATAAVKKSGTAHTAAEKQAKTFSGQIKILQAAAIDLGTKIGDKLIPILTKLARGLSDGVKWLEHHKEASKALAIVIATVLGAAIGSFVAVKVAAFVGGMKSMISAVGRLAAMMLTTLVPAFATAEGEIIAGTEAMAVSVDAALIGTGVGAALVALGAAAYLLRDQWKEVMVGLEELAQNMANYVIGVLNELLEKLNKLTFGLLNLKINPITGAGEGGGSQKEEEATARSGPSAAELKRMGLGGLGNAKPEGKYGAINEAAKKYGIDPSVLWGVYGTETSYGKNISTSSAGAQGAFQFIPETAKRYHYPLTNHPSEKQFQEQASAAAHYLSDLVKQTGSVNAALALYSGHTAGYAQKVASNSHAVGGNTLAVEHSTKAHHKAAAKVTGPSSASIVKWAEGAVGKFPESTGPNRGPELDRLQSEFHTRAAAWCAEFATTAAMMGGANKAVRTASVATVRQWAQAGTHGYHRGVGHTPAAGDIAMFGNAHAGFVQSVDKARGTYVDIEGNTSAGKVARVTRKIGEGDFARPAYKKIESGGVELTRASKAFEQAAKQAQQKMAADTKIGQTQLSKIVGAIHSGGVKELTAVVGGKHNTWLAHLVDKLHGDHTSALDKLAAKLVTAHKAGLEALKKALVKQAEEATTKRLQHEDVEKKDRAEGEATAIADNVKVALDHAAEKGLGGAALGAAQAQTNLDAVKAANDAAISGAKIAADRVAGMGAYQEAIAQHNLEAAENAAKVTEANAQAALDMANNAASEAQAEATRASEAQTKATEENTQATEKQTAAEATPTGPPITLNFYSNASPNDVVKELGWALKTGSLPAAVAQPLPVAA